MLGIEDYRIYMGYLLALLALVICIVYGIVNWNKGERTSEEELSEDIAWKSEDNEINDKID